ncbi:MAG TPA: hypothetical protein VEO00_04530 [Actinomycetota bacterium]|nr:hypothetical protein [Actinomycetota bacterium]
MDVEVTATPTGKTSFEKWLAVLVGLAAVVASLLATLQTHSSKREELSLEIANRLSVAIFERIAGSAPVQSFSLASSQDALTVGLNGTARLIAAFDHPDVAETAVAIGNASNAASDRLVRLATTMGTPPGEESGVDAHTREVAAATDDQLNALVAEQNRAVDVANRFGERGNRAVFGLSLLALGAVLLGLAGVVGEGGAGRIAIVAGSAALGLSILWGASALLV